MPNIVSGAEIVSGGASADIIVAAGGDGSSAISAGAGDDVVFGDHGALFVDALAGNGTLATAIKIDAAASWSTRANPDVGDTSVPYTTVLGRGAGQFDYFAVTLAAGATLTLDIDWGYTPKGGPAFDPWLRLYGGDTGLLVSDDDNVPPGEGRGSPGIGGLLYDSHVVFTATAAGVYYIEVGRFSGPTVISTGSTYMLNVSATGHAATDTTPFGDDVINGGDGSDVLYGVDGDDLLDGGGGNDEILGGTGDDLMRGGAGVDLFDGGEGSDTADYRAESAGVFAELSGGATSTVLIAGVGLADRLVDVENLYGGSARDVLSGDAASNLLVGNAGNDVLNGYGGADRLIGGDGLDTADYRDKSAAVVVTLDGSASAAVTVGGVAEDVIAGIEFVYGGAAADRLTGDGFANYFRGGGGADEIDGGAGLDGVDFRDKATAVALTLNGANAAAATVGGVAEDVVRNIEVIYGGSASDTLVGDDQNNQLYGGAGSDRVRGGGGSDVLSGGAGPDIFAYGGDLSASQVTTTGLDKIIDFETGDVIDLRAIDADVGAAGDQALVLGPLASGTAGRLAITATSRANEFLVAADVDGDGRADFGLIVASSTALSAADFLL